MRSYARSAAIEPLRKFFRIVDLVLLLTALRMEKRLPSFAELRKTTFVELGPGPMRLAFVKRLIFGQVFFVDRSDFGVCDPGLRVVDLELFDNAGSIVRDVCGLSSDAAVLLFADHCLEHVSEDVLSGFLKSVVHDRLLSCFRVPNILSPCGSRNFMRDATHRTSFSSGLRERVDGMGFEIFPWIRWYRPLPILKALFRRQSWMNQAEEIAICTSRAAMHS
jgi:hypothetical protein